VKKVLFSILALILAVGVALPMAAPAVAHTGDDPMCRELLAGQSIPVGEVCVWNDGAKLYVKYKTSGGWQMTATHLEVVTNIADFPTTKKGNPKLGKFTYKETHGMVTEYTYEVPLEWAPWTLLYIAAHAVVVNGTDEENAWAFKPPCWGGWFNPDRGSWATYIKYRLQG